MSDKKGMPLVERWKSKENGIKVESNKAIDRAIKNCENKQGG